MGRICQIFLKGSTSTMEFRETRKFKGRQKEYKNRDDSVEELGEIDDVNDPRWYNIQNKLNNGSDRLDVRNGIIKKTGVIRQGKSIYNLLCQK